MASFKLGCIRGAKGEKGDTGAKGERGDIGPAGEKGTDGCTPVFSIEAVETIESYMEASAEIDSSDPSQPKLRFRLPRGADGRDAAGDMEKSIYDTQGRGEDIYAFAMALFDGALSVSGGTLLGKLKAYLSPMEEGCVRNICFSPKLPESGMNGDLCFVKAGKDSLLCDNPVGSILLLDEGNDTAEYIVAAKDFHGEGSVSLIRKYLLDNAGYFDYRVRDSYYLSDIDIYLEGVFEKVFKRKIREHFSAVQLEESEKRSCFLPSDVEYRIMDYFVQNSAATTTRDGRKYYCMTRSLDDINRVLYIDSNSLVGSQRQNTKMGIRPMIVLPGSLGTVNVLHNDSSAMRLAAEVQGIYVFDDGQWKELGA